MDFRLHKSTFLSVLMLVSIYLFLMVIFSMSGFAIAMYLLYLFMAILITSLLLEADKKRPHQESNEFKRLTPFEDYGTAIADFQYSFLSDDKATIDEVSDDVLKSLESKMMFSPAEAKTIADKDKALAEHEDREFFIAKSRETNRGGIVSFILAKNVVGEVYSVRWWFLVSGAISTKSVLFFLANAPIFLPFFIIPRLRGELDLAVSLKKIYPADYEAQDLTVILNSANKVAMIHFLKSLQSKEIDTSDLEKAVKDGYIDFSKRPELQVS